MKTFIVFIFATMVGIGQTAKVAPLSYEDFQRASSAKAALDKAQADWDAMRKDIEQRYVSDSREDVYTGASSSIQTVHGDASSVLVGGFTTYDNSDAHAACRSIGQGIAPVMSTIQLCRKLLDLRSKSRAEQEAEDAKERERVEKLPKVTVYTLKRDWINGFEFSEDLRYIVPRAPSPTPTCYSSGMYTWPVARQ